MPEIIATAEPFLFPGSRTGCLLIHGFTGTPKEMRWMGEYLAKEGYSVLGVRLAGHATRPEDMIRSRWTDWVTSVEGGYHILRGLADHIYLIGLSLGGSLALLLSTRLDIKGVVAVSTPMYVPGADWRLNYVETISRFWPYLRKGKYPPGYGWFDKDAWKDHISYPRNPTRSVAELDRVLAALRAALPDIRVPVLLIHSQDDGYVLPADMEGLYAALTNVTDKAMLSVRGSGHVVTRDAARQQVFEATADFIRRVESSSA